MATLEKIRSKSVFLIVIIAVALLAFILGDAITNGRNLFGHGSTVAEVDGKKIDFADYQRKHQELTQRMEEQRQQNPNMDPQILAQQTLDEMIAEALLDQAVDRAGIKVTPELLRFVMIESPQPLPKMQELIKGLQQQGLPVQTPEDAYKAIFNPQAVGLTDAAMAPYQRAWVAMEEEYRNQIGKQMYYFILGSSYKANDLDIKAMKRDYAATADVKMAKKTYADVDKQNIKVSDEEIKKEYEKQKNRYAVLEPTKEVSFLSYTVKPSAADKAAANKLKNEALNQLRTNGKLSKDLQKEGLSIEHHDMRMSDIKDAKLKEFLSTAEPEAIGEITTNLDGFMIVKMGKNSSALDSIKFSAVTVAGKTLPAKVLTALEGGLNPDSLSTRFSTDSVMYQAAQWMPLYTAQGKTPIANMGITEEKFDEMVANVGNYVNVLENDQVTVYAKVEEKKSEKPVVSYETIEYVIHPSENTIAQAQAKLQKFLDSNKNVANFAANAQKAGFTVQPVTLTASSAAVPQMVGGFFPDSRAVVRWVMIDGEKGDVSKIYMSKDPETPMLYAAAVTDVYEDFTPWTNAKVKDELTQQIKKSKYGDALIKQYSSKGSLEDIAAAMGTEVKEITDMKAQRNPDVSDAKVIGRIMGSKPGQKAQLIKGDDGVYAVIVNKVGQEPNEISDEQFGQMFVGQKDPIKVLRGKKKVSNNIYKFEPGE